MRLFLLHEKLYYNNLALENNNYLIINLNDKKCWICRKEKPLIKHHIQYEPEIMLRICNVCHDDIHHASWGKENIGYEDKYEPSAYREFIWYTSEERDDFYEVDEN
ncbi:MAG: hypothetical protein IH842_01470 [Thaumarchaeota archaeon]|nr:hypothetical protein [Nitrososphaerota archaeon]